MALSLQLGYPDVPKSVTNPNVKSTDALDNNSPISFLTFIKIINVSFEPDSLQAYYNYYLKTWNNNYNKSKVADIDVITERYREFLKEISLNYTTKEEKQFLSKIDFNDPYDLDVVMGFYGRKLKELSLFYNTKRNDIKFNVVRNKLKGTNFGIEKTISELTLSYLKNLDDGKMLYDFDSIKHKLEIEIEELYDIYPLYFNQEPNPLEYDKKDLDYGYNIFLVDDSTTISKYLSGFSQELQNLKEVDQLFDNKRKLTEKYISTDFYYLSTGSTVNQFLSGKLFSSDKPINNFLNRNYPTTASIEVDGYLKSSREKGFFRPSNTTIILIDGLNLSYSINLSNLSPNSLYFFPDPNITGTNGDVLTFIVDDSYLKKNFSSGNAVNQPTTSPFDTKYNGYVSKIEPNTQKYLDSIFDQGVIQDSKKDIYNNLYGLFKKNGKFYQNVQSLDLVTINNMVINGYQFYDDLYNEGFSFNWSTIDDSTFTETIRTGLSTFTGSFSSTNPELILYFGQYTPYNELIDPTESNLVTTYEIIEGAFISKSDYTLYDDSISSDLSAFDMNIGSFYYTDLIEGGINNSSPLQRALLDPTFPSLTANLLKPVRGSLIDVVEGNRFEIPFETDFQFSSNDYQLDFSTENNTQYTLSANYDPDFDINGKILIRNSTSRQVLPLLNTFPYLTSKYNSDVINEFDSNILNFEVSNDILLIESQSYFTIDKILFENGIFKDPRTQPIQLNHSTNGYDKLSNRFKKTNDIFYCKLATNSTTISSNNFIIYPEIYQFDTINFKNKKIFPQHIDDITEYFNISGGDVRYIKADTPLITYSSRNNVFNISFLLKDQNNMMVLHGYNFIMNPDVTFINHTINKSGSMEYSNSFDVNIQSNINIFLSGGNVTIQSEELIL